MRFTGKSSGNVNTVTRDSGMVDLVLVAINYQSESSTYSAVGCSSSSSSVDKSRIFFDDAAARIGRRDAPESRVGGRGASNIRLSSSSLLLSSTLPFLDGAFEAIRDFIADAFGAARFGMEEKKSSIVDGAAGFDFLPAGWTFSSSADELRTGLRTQQ